MTWQKALVVIFLFYFLALLQGSFFAQFSLFGAVPSLVFILFFLSVFFGKKDNYLIIFLAFIAGIFLDLFSPYTYLGVSIALLLLVGFLLKKTQAMLKNRGDNNPFIYFAPLFLVYLVFYEIFLKVVLRYLDPSRSLIVFDSLFAIGIVYNLILATIGFWIFKKYGKGI
ncbi:MAG: hypothetical protein NT155_04315 [Candidatus Staskawiczbacteria bacterium]|nr:hypothetical protein [Candidatus Staskawiczbacteria bacterium]